MLVEQWSAVLQPGQVDRLGRVVEDLHAEPVGAVRGGERHRVGTVGADAQRLGRGDEAVLGELVARVVVPVHVLERRGPGGEQHGVLVVAHDAAGRLVEVEQAQVEALVVEDGQGGDVSEHEQRLVGAGVHVQVARAARQRDEVDAGVFQIEHVQVTAVLGGDERVPAIRRQRDLDRAHGVVRVQREREGHLGAWRRAGHVHQGHLATRQDHGAGAVVGEQDGVGGEAHAHRSAAARGEIDDVDLAQVHHADVALGERSREPGDGAPAVGCEREGVQVTTDAGLTLEHPLGEHGDGALDAHVRAVVVSFRFAHAGVEERGDAGAIGQGE